MTRWRKGDDSDFEFQFIDVSNPRGIAADTRMLSVDQIHSRDIEDAHEVLLVDLTEEMETKRINRLPVLDREKRLKFVVHKSVIDRYLIARRRDIETATLDDLLHADAYLPLITAVVFVPLAATMAEARQAMVARPNCQDVFLTANGAPAEPVVGWITNTDFRRTRT